MTEHRERFRRLYEANYDPLLGYAMRRANAVEDAHDVVSETFATAWRRLEDVPDGDRARLWLYGTARKVLANHYRGDRRRRRLGIRLQAEPPSPPVTPFDDRDDSGRISAAFARLAADDRELLILGGWEELTSAEIAEVVGCKPAAARVRLHRARKRLANELDKEGVKHPTAPGHGTTRWATARPDPEEVL